MVFEHISLQIKASPGKNASLVFSFSGLGDQNWTIKSQIQCMQLVLKKIINSKGKYKTISNK